MNTDLNWSHSKGLSLDIFTFSLKAIKSLLHLTPPHVVSRHLFHEIHFLETSLISVHVELCQKVFVLFKEMRILGRNVKPNDLLGHSADRDSENKLYDRLQNVG